MFVETVIVGPLMVNCYLVGCEQSRRAVLIDPGDDEEKLIQKLHTAGLELDYILLTHGHIDHITAVAPIRKACGGKIVIHQNDAFLIENSDNQAKMLGLKEPESFTPDEFIKEGDRLAIDGFDISVIETPGHSPGGVCFKVDDCLFVGDTLFYDSIGRTDLFGGSYDELMSSIQNKLLILPPDTNVYPGHGQPTTIAREKEHNPFINQSF